MELVTTHTHTDFCPHAADSIADMACAAHEAGITTLAVTEHYPLTPQIDPRRYISMDKDDLPAYFAAIEEARRQYPQMEVLTGCEMDWLGTFDDRGLTAEDFAAFDIMLCSIHFVDAWPLDDASQRGHWDEVGADHIWRRYFESFCDAAVSDWPITIMSHPDLCKKYDYYPSFDPASLYRAAAEACRAGGRMIELNTSGNYYACKEVFPGTELLREFCRAGVPCTLGTDAHETGHIARDVMHGYRKMYEAGYRTVTVPTRDGDRRQIPLDL